MKKILSTALPAMLVFFLAGCSDQGESLEVTGPPLIPGPVSFASDIQPIFSSNCVGCHGDGGNGGLDLRPGMSYGNLVSVAAEGGSGNRVEPGEAAASFLYQRLADTTGAGMPPSGPLPLSTREMVAEWINDGANDN
jgi:Planctomycete cytochrome C